MAWDIIGHEWAASLLQQNIASGALHHAYLISGPPGVGRRTLALRFAQAVNCPQAVVSGVPCGVCRTCKLIEQQKYADLFVVDVLPEKSEISIDQVRALQHSLSLSAVEGRYRVALILNAQRASEGAQNALLKTLEEAPTQALLILIAETADDMLPTIVSRCEQIRLRPMVIDLLSQALHARWGLPDGEASILAHLAGGRLGYALNLHQDHKLLEQHQGWLADIPLLLAMTYRERMIYAEAATKKRDRMQFKGLLVAWETYWRDIFLTAARADLPLTNLEQVDEIRALAERIGYDCARNVLTEIELSIDRLDANANQRLLLDVLLLDWPRLSA